MHEDRFLFPLQWTVGGRLGDSGPNARQAVELVRRRVDETALSPRVVARTIALVWPDNASIVMAAAATVRKQLKMLLHV